MARRHWLGAALALFALLLQGGLTLVVHHTAHPHTHGVLASAGGIHDHSGHVHAAGDHVHADVAAHSDDEEPGPSRDPADSLCVVAAAIGLTGKTLLASAIVVPAPTTSYAAVVIAALVEPFRSERFTASPRAPPASV